MKSIFNIFLENTTQQVLLIRLFKSMRCVFDSLIHTHNATDLDMISTKTEGGEREQKFASTNTDCEHH